MLIISKRKDGTIANIRRGGRTYIHGSSQKGKNRNVTGKTASQSMTPAPETFLASKREILEGDEEDELETNRIREKCHKKA